ncbi:[Fe-Fe] hydrogenase large subunit C-terminal domain-containing protein [Azotosporobacter soli]|uniref:[Fe-Fe] hydrogenase large subunit C-terminal domain-containing protein n=1 Tax=Azotosporobacter soli TaxID=3055040 RepID=UPI0031FF3334
MIEYFHSVRLISERCKGCVSCIKRCPTEAIRIRGGKAKITESRCIDCGECIRYCPNRAKTAVTDSLADIKRYPHNVALPAPSLYSQFEAQVTVDAILCGLLSLGFDEVFDVAVGAEVVTTAIRELLQHKQVKRPLISSACPAVVRLIQVKFPELIDHLVPFEAPVEIAARMVREEYARRTGRPQDELGVWFITPCPAKLTAIRQPLGDLPSNISGAISIADIFGELRRVILQKPAAVAKCRRASWAGMGWAVAGGETEAAGVLNTLVVHEIHSISNVLEQVAMGKLKDIDYVEALACAGGCIGGPLMVENRFVAEHRMRNRLAVGKRLQPQPELPLAPEDLVQRGTLEPRPIMRLDEDISKALYKVEQMERTLERLPGLDCGSCGSPTCKALAEDIVQGQASEMDCIFKLRERVHELAKEMMGLAEKLPPSLDKKEKKGAIRDGKSKRVAGTSGRRGGSDDSGGGA